MPIIALSQDTACDLIEGVTDKMTGDIRWGSTEKIIVSEDLGKAGFGILCMIPASNKKALIISIGGFGEGFNCVDENDKMNILFRDGTRLELGHMGDSNCKGKFSLYFGDHFGKMDELELLKERKWKQFDYGGRGNYCKEI